jgi:ABC-type Fe3+/spermidine/putrescine transport system ATPase subunit
VSLHVDGITVRYGSKVAVFDLTLDVAPGERFAVMGPSGSGKSTLLRSIAGLTAIDSGTIAIDGEDMTRVPAHRRPVGLMFQDYALFPHMTVAQNVAYGLRMAGMPSAERSTRSLDLLGLVGLDGFADRKPATLSGGEQQRVALARTLAPEPSVVLLDEPLGSLDVSLRESLLAETRSILDTVGATSIYVTHDRTEAFAFCDRMAVMHDGGIVRIGTPTEIWHAPGSPFVAAAIGQSNLVEMAAIASGCTGLGFVPLDAARMDDGGRLTGIISASRFRDGLHIARVTLADGTATLDLYTPRDMAIGSRIRFDVDLERVVVVSADEV